MAVFLFFFFFPLQSSVAYGIRIFLQETVFVHGKQFLPKGSSCSRKHFVHKVEVDSFWVPAQLTITTTSPLSFGNSLLIHRDGLPIAMFICTALNTFPSHGCWHLIHIESTIVSFLRKWSWDSDGDKIVSGGDYQCNMCHLALGAVMLQNTHKSQGHMTIIIYLHSCMCACQGFGWSSLGPAEQLYSMCLLSSCWH